MVPKLFQEGFLPYNFCWIQKTYFSTQVLKCQVSSFALGLTKFVLKNCVKMWANCKKVKPPPLSFMYVMIESPVLKLPIFKSCFLFTDQRFAGLVKSQGKWSFLKKLFSTFTFFYTSWHPPCRYHSHVLNLNTYTSIFQTYGLHLKLTQWASLGFSK